MMPLPTLLEMCPCLNLDTCDTGAEVPCGGTPLLLSGMGCHGAGPAPWGSLGQSRMQRTPPVGPSLEQLGIAQRLLRAGTRTRGEDGVTPQVMNCSVQTPRGVPEPSGQVPGEPQAGRPPSPRRGERVLQGRVPSPTSQSTVRHLIVPVPTISLAWIYASRGHLWRDSNNTTLLAFLFLL